VRIQGNEEWGIKNEKYIGNLFSMNRKRIWKIGIFAKKKKLYDYVKHMAVIGSFSLNSSTIFWEDIACPLHGMSLWAINTCCIACFILV
jgi:hypothetical protein